MCDYFKYYIPYTCNNMHYFFNDPKKINIFLRLRDFLKNKKIVSTVKK